MPEIERETPKYDGIKITAGQQVCMNRCISKIENVRELVDFKVLHSPMGGIEVDMPPVLFN